MKPLPTRTSPLYHKQGKEYWASRVRHFIDPIGLIEAEEMSDLLTSLETDNEGNTDDQQVFAAFYKTAAAIRRSERIPGSRKDWCRLYLFYIYICEMATQEGIAYMNAGAKKEFSSLDGRFRYFSSRQRELSNMKRVVLADIDSILG